MKQDPYVLRDQVAGPTLKRIGDDRKRVCPAIKRALEVIEGRLFDPALDVNAVWRQSRLPRKSTALFKAELGEPPGKYIDARRVEVGAKLVAGTDISIATIGETVGYLTTSATFSRKFEKCLGMRPSEYREAVKVRRDGESLEQLSGWMGQVGLASAAGDFEGANRFISRVSTAVREQQIQDLAADLALACHQRGAQRTREGDVDQAYDDLAFARRCYGQAGDLQPRVLRHRRHIAVSHDTDEALTSQLCPPCRTILAGKEGHSLREALRQALRMIPRDLEWFEVCCDDCYRVAWNAISRARAGLMDDAWKAWWISTHADLADRETPPSRGRIIAALAEVERMVTGDQLERKAYCDLAFEDAAAIGDSFLEIQARIWRASVLRAMGELTEAREELRSTADASRATPWLAALHDRMAGILEDYANHHLQALRLLRSATELYGHLDPHISGIFLLQQAYIQLYLAEYEESLHLCREASTFFDDRRDPLPGNALIPLHSASCFALLGNWERAESYLSSCCFQREAHPGLAAAELFNRACLELIRGHAQESVALFVEVKGRFEELNRPIDVALAASYSVEAYARLGDRNGSITNAMAALSFFQAAGCTKDTLNAVGQLRVLLEADVIDISAITLNARMLGRQHGGWLPET